MRCAVLLPCDRCEVLSQRVGQAAEEALAAHHLTAREAAAAAVSTIDEDLDAAPAARHPPRACRAFGLDCMHLIATGRVRTPKTPHMHCVQWSV